MELKPGNLLQYEGNNFFSVYHNGKIYKIMQLEKETYKELQEKLNNQWKILKIYIRFIVAYKLKEEPDKEYAIIIPTIELQKE